MFSSDSPSGHHARQSNASQWCANSIFTAGHLFFRNAITTRNYVHVGHVNTVNVCSWQCLAANFHMSHAAQMATSSTWFFIPVTCFPQVLKPQASHNLLRFLHTSSALKRQENMFSNRRSGYSTQTWRFLFLKGRSPDWQENVTFWDCSGRLMGNKRHATIDNR